MRAVAALESGTSIPWSELRPLIGAEVAVDTDLGPLEGTLLSCTKQSAWIVAGDVDHVVALPHLHGIHRR
jgi:hypothetical protein